MTRLVEVKNDFSQSLENDGLKVLRGWDITVAKAAVKGSREPYMMKKAPNDWSRRFANLAEAQEWYSNPEKQPTIYTLRTMADNAIGGLMWFSHQTHPGSEGEVTVAIRMYESLREQGFASRFFESAHEDFAQMSKYNGVVWLATAKTENEEAIGLYTSHGYEVVGEDEEDLIMDRPVSVPVKY